MGRRHDCAGGSGLFEDPVDVGAAGDQLPEAEFSALRRAGGYCCVLGEFATRVEGEDEPALEPEDCDCARRARLLVYEVGCDDAVRLQAEAVAIEDERAFAIVDGRVMTLRRGSIVWLPPLPCSGLRARSSSSTASSIVIGQSWSTSRSRWRHVVAEERAPEAASSR